MNDDVINCYSSCYKCNKRIKIEYYEEACETKENVTFLGDLGTEIYSYCPYCGVKHTGFRPYDLQTERTAEFEDDDEEEWEDDSYWPEAEGVTLIDDDDEEEDGDPWEMDDESLLVAFTCPSCGQKFRLNPKGSKKIYCYFCGKEAKEA